MATAATALVTFAEFEQLPDPPGSRLELHNGEVVDVPPPKLRHSLIEHRIYDALKAIVDSTTFVGMEVGFRIGDREYRVADLGVLPLQRIEDAPLDGYLEGSPEVVIEVLSPSNSATEMYTKEQLCLENGCREFWVVNPRNQTVRISTPTGPSTVWKPGDQIPLLYGGTLPVNAIFA
ncbi:MAG: Uma2 family endonuclease [Acidobacteriia bacterium]|nr:Uma2 family endonuclease [Terriglobia bacterium]